MRDNKYIFLFTLLYSLTLIALSIYSFSQIDLNLTLSSNQVYQSIQQKLIFLGYFQRSTSTVVYLILVLLLFLSQIIFLLAALRGKINSKYVWKISILSVVLLLFSYPAFSHDIFNYIFDARIAVTHKVSPWAYTALDFPDDLWTRFMHWTHRTYPYGPGWLILTIPFYVAGLGKFTLTLLWFKVLGAISYLTSVWFIKKILEKVSFKNITHGMLLFALNPLIIIESLISAHIDIAMTAFFLAAIYFALNQKNKMANWVMLLLSASIKYITVSAIPAWIWWKGNISRFEKAILVMLALVILTTGYVIAKQEILPWYFITPLALISLLPNKKDLMVISIFLSIGLLLWYAPYLLYGEYSDWVKNTRQTLTIIPLLMAFAWVIWKKRKNFSSLFS